MFAASLGKRVPRPRAAHGELACHFCVSAPPSKALCWASCRESTFSFFDWGGDVFRPVRLMSTHGHSFLERYRDLWPGLGFVLSMVVATATGTHLIDNRLHQGELRHYQTKMDTLQAEVNTMKYLLQVTHTEDYRPVAEKLKKDVKGDEEKRQEHA